MKMTIIIPTRSRANTLRYALLTCTTQAYEDLEIIVSDNCSDDDTEAVVRSVNDPRVRYLKTPQRISMRANFEFALSHVREGFVGFIGDDDGLLPDAIERAASFLARSGLKALTSVMAFYRWPCAPDSIKNSGILQFCPGGDVTRNPAEYIDKTLKGTGAFYIHDLPSLYYGFAHASLARARGGDQFFNSMIPDAYSAFAIAAQVAHFGYLAEPLFIIGASGRSNGVSTFVKDARKEELASFVAENDFSFHHDYPVCNSLAVSVHESFRQVLERYPGVAQVARANPRDLIRYMAREANERNRSELLAAAIDIGNRSGIDQSEVQKAFKPGNIYVSKLILALMKRLMNEINERKLTKQYSDMLIHGVRNSFQAALFFHEEIQRLKANGRRS